MEIPPGAEAERAKKLREQLSEKQKICKREEARNEKSATRKPQNERCQEKQLLMIRMICGK